MAEATTRWQCLHKVWEQMRQDEDAKDMLLRLMCLFFFLFFFSHISTVGRDKERVKHISHTR